MVTRALLLAAGKGTRLRPLTETVAKPALPILDVPLGTWGLVALARHHSPVALNVSHLPETVIEALSRHGERLEVLLEEPAPLGTGGTLHALRARVADRLVVWNADVIADIDLGALLDRHRATGLPATLALMPVTENADFEVERGRPVALIDRRRRSAPGSRFIGVAVYERAALDLLDERVPQGATEGLLEPLLRRGDLGGYEHDGYARDVGTLNRYLRVSLDLLEGSAPPPRGGWPGEVVEVDGGRTYVGVGVEAERAALGPGAVLLAGCSVAPGARVTRSIVWPGEPVPAGAVLRDCVWFQGRALPVAG